MLTLIEQDGGRESGEQRRLFPNAHRVRGGALEFIAAAGEESVQDRIGLLADRPDDVPVEREVSLRLLRHVASSVRHRQFYDTDIATVNVKHPTGAGRTG